MESVKNEPSVGALLGALARDTGDLVKQEVRLASTEFGAKITNAAQAVGWIAAGGAVAHAGVLALLTALIAALSPVVPVWASSLVVGVLMGGAGTALVWKGTKVLRHLDPVPQQTAKTLKEGAVWAKEQVR